MTKTDCDFGTTSDAGAVRLGGMAPSLPGGTAVAPHEDGWSWLDVADNGKVRLGGMRPAF